MNELRPKLFDVMKGYTKEQLIKDILSGIIVAIIALPLSIALAIASGVGPVQGLYTAIVAGFFIPFSEEAVYRLADQLPHLLLSSMAS
jgi:Sulfate permease and related transporters (MFS superfamily)